jgi:uncharacterized membrane-anchored protein YhcB (DUF1043 family)
MILVAFLAGLGIGALAHRALNDAIRLGQENAHKQEMDEMGAELKRARIQVANLIGKE